MGFLRGTGLGQAPHLFHTLQSGYPGFGESRVLQDQDHIQICKPGSPADEAYIAVREVVRAEIDAAATAVRLMEGGHEY